MDKERIYLSERIIWYLTIFLIAAFNIFDSSSAISLILFGTTLAILIVGAIHRHGKFPFFIDRYQLFVSFFGFFCLASSLWAWSSSLAIEKGITIFEILICSSVLYYHYSKYDSIDLLISAIMWAGYVVAGYAIVFYGLDSINEMIAKGARLDNSFTNINSIAMVSGLAIVITVYRIFCIERRLSLYNIFMIPALVLIAASGSRKAMVVVFVGIVVILMLKFEDENIIKTIFKWLIGAIVLIFLIKLLLMLPMFDLVNARMKGLVALVTGNGIVDHSAWLRQQYIQVGLEQFIKTPVFGIGMNNARFLIAQAFGKETYLHNNYVELLVNGGIVGFIIYYSMYIYLMFSLIKRRKVDDKGTIICIAMLIIFLISDYGAVSYYSKSRYVYLAIFFLQDKILRRKCREYEYY